HSKVHTCRMNLKTVQRFAILELMQLDASRQYSSLQLDDAYSTLQGKSHAFNLIRRLKPGLDWNIVFTRFNQYYDKELPLPSEKSFPNVFGRKQRSEYYADYISRSFLFLRNDIENAVLRVRCMKNLEKITLALLLYNAENGTLPPAFTVDAAGNPLHSWRVLILPYLGDPKLNELYGRIKLDEPFDSEHNKLSHNQTPGVFRCPEEVASGKMKPEETTYVVLLDEDSPFDGSGTGVDLNSFGRDSETLVLVTERIQPGNWMNPKYDSSFEKARDGIGSPTSGLHKSLGISPPTAAPAVPLEIGSLHFSGCSAGTRNGAVKSVQVFSSNSGRVTAGSK
ncbi:MAG: DUF1559 domain-containing protein, partial [Thermoguttaceae bacterium]